MNPKVSFIVPCYNLSHLLTECVDSILLQSYQSFEVLIMDDCSPDNTPEVAAAFDDPRVIHIRNETNLGNLSNFNKGIELARGDYVWLISADDRIRSPHVLERYVMLMERHPGVGFVCCPAIKLEDGQEKELLQYTVLAKDDTIFEGVQILKKFLECNPVAAPAAMVRKSCYTEISMFPLDLPYAGDWYLWCMFALYCDVAYLCEPMVNYRHHNLSLTNILKERDMSILLYNDIDVLSRISRKAQHAGKGEIVAECTRTMMTECMRYLLEEVWRTKFDDVEIEKILNRCEMNQSDRNRLGTRMYVGLADHCYSVSIIEEARKFYLSALRRERLLPEVWLKYICLHLGNAGKTIRSMMSSIRSHLRH